MIPNVSARSSDFEDISRAARQSLVADHHRFAQAGHSVLPRAAGWIHAPCVSSCSETTRRFGLAPRRPCAGIDVWSERPKSMELVETSEEDRPLTVQIFAERFET